MNLNQYYIVNSIFYDSLCNYYLNFDTIHGKYLNVYE